MQNFVGKKNSSEAWKINPSKIGDVRHSDWNVGYQDGKKGVVPRFNRIEAYMYGYAYAAGVEDARSPKIDFPKDPGETARFTFGSDSLYGWYLTAYWTVDEEEYLSNRYEE